MTLLLVLLALLGLASSTIQAQTPSPTAVRSVMTDRNVRLNGSFTNLISSNLVDVARSVPLKVASVSELLSLGTNMPLGAMVEVAGYYGAGDGGGGSYVLTSGVSGTNALGGRLAATGGTSSWELQGDIKPEHFGAKGDGTGSDQAAVNAAIQFGILVGRPTFAPRTYRITSSINLPSNSHLDGQGTGKIKRAFPAAGSTSWGAVQSSPIQFVYWLNNPLQEEVQVTATNIVLKNIWVYNEDINSFTNGRLVSFVGAQNVLLENVTIGGTNQGIKSDWATDFWVNDGRFINVKVHNGPGIYTDGFHVLGGRRGYIENLWSTAGDDALAFIPPNNNVISDWIVKGAHLTSYNGFMLDIGISEVLNVTNLTAPVRNIQVSGVTGEFGQRNGAIKLFDKIVSGTNYAGLLSNIRIDGFNASMNTSFATYGITNGAGFTMFGGTDVTLQDFVATNCWNPIRLEQPTRLTLNKVKYRNSQLPGLTLIGGRDWSRLLDMDMEHNRSSSLIQIENSDNVSISGGRFANLGAGPGIRYTDVLGFRSFGIANSLIEGNQIGIYFFNNPRSFTISGTTFGTNVTPKIVYNTGTARGAVTSAAGYSIGSTSITLAVGVGSGTISAGDFITFGADTNRYLVTVGTGNVAGGPTISIASPGLLQAISTVQVGVNVVNPLVIYQSAGNSGLADNFQSGISTTFKNPATFESPDFSTAITMRRSDSGASMTASMASGFPTFTASGNWFEFTSLLGLYGRNSSANNADKTFNFAIGNYTTANSPVALIRGRSLASTSPIDIGGGTSSQVAATSVNFWGATNNTTATGTILGSLQMRADQTDTNNSPLILYLAGVGNTVKAAATGSRELYIGPSYSPGQLAEFTADRGDGNYTVVAGVPLIVRFQSALTANRTVSFTTTGMLTGSRYRIVRTGLGVGTLDVGGLKTIPSATAAWVEVLFNGTSMELIGYGTL